MTTLPEEPEGAEEFSPQNRLEEFLVRAAQDPDERIDFYRAFLEADIYVLGTTDEPGRGDRVADGETMLFLHQWDVGGKRIVPVFSSLSRLADFVDKQAAYVRINAGALLSMLGPEVGAILNPGSSYSKEFHPAEIQMLLDGTLFAPDTEEFVLSDGEIFLGQPADYPTELVEALKELFAEQSAVRAAYLAQMYAPESGEAPHLVIGLDVLRNFDEVVEEAVDVAGEVLAEDEFVDFIQIGRDALSDYLLGETTPFYEQEI